MLYNYLTNAEIPTIRWNSWCLASLELQSTCQFPLGGKNKWIVRSYSFFKVLEHLCKCITHSSKTQDVVVKMLHSTDKAAKCSQQFLMTEHLLYCAKKGRTPCVPVRWRFSFSQSFINWQISSNSQIGPKIKPHGWQRLHPFHHLLKLRMTQTLAYLILMISTPVKVRLTWSPAAAQSTASSCNVIPGNE